MRKINYSKIDKNDYLKYLGLINENGKETKKLEILQKRWKVLRSRLIYIRNNSGVNPNKNINKIYPKNVKKLILSDFSKLTDIYLDYMKSTYSSTFKECAKKIFRYDYKYKFSKDIDIKYNTKIADFFIDKSEELDITTCFYCESSYVNAYPIEGKIKRQFDLDHFYLKADCPILALSFYNLIPSCQICNSRVKGATNLNDLYELNGKSEDKKKCLNKLSPSSKDYDYEDSVTIRVFPKKNNNEPWSPTINFSDFDDKYKIVFTTDEEIYKKDTKAFHLEERYNYKNNKKEMLNLLDLKRKYSDSYIDLICKTVSNNNIKLYPFEVKEAIFHEISDTSNHRLFVKAKKDILSMWDR